MTSLGSDKPGATSPPKRPRNTVLVVEDDTDQREWLKEELEHEGFVVETATGGHAGVERVKAGGIDLVVSDVKMPDLDGLDLLREIRNVDPLPFAIIVTAYGSIDTAIRAVKYGAFDYLTKPFKIDSLLLSIDKALAERALRSEVARLRKETRRRDRPENIIGRSAPMQETIALIQRAAETNANLLITGESGTGKKLVARTLHAMSPRKDRPFLTINCTAVPEKLLENDLFGYGRGAHSATNVDRRGLIVAANGGTLFFDEITEMPMVLQPRLLSVLQEREVRPSGMNSAIHVDLRVIAATNQDIERLLHEGRFREDLYYRLNIIQISLPPLRTRQDDILPLTQHFLDRAVESSGKLVKGWNEDVKKALLTYRWPGNVRELENVVERAVALSEYDQISLDDLPHAMKESRSQARRGSDLAKAFTLDELEHEYIERVMEMEDGNKTRAAQRLGLDRKTLYRKLGDFRGDGQG